MAPRVLQVSRTDGQCCGIAYFARNLDKQLRAAGVIADLRNDLELETDADIVVIQHHWELFSDDEITGYCRALNVPVVVFGHEPGIERFAGTAGFASMTPGRGPASAKPVFSSIHPAWFPGELTPRAVCRARTGVPTDRLIIGSSGFVRFERQFPAIVRQLVPVARDRGWFVELLASPWKEPSPGVVEQLGELATEFPESFRITTRYLDPAELNLRLQACDLIWSWTSSPSRAYASGAISDQYASGTRVFACGKRQYEAVLGLPNSVTGPADLPGFVAGLIAEAERTERSCTGDGGPRHEPGPVSWDTFTAAFIAFLNRISVTEPTRP